MSTFSIKEDIIRNVLFMCKCVGLEGICHMARDRSFVSIVSTQEFANESAMHYAVLPNALCNCSEVANGCYRLLLLCTAVYSTSAESVPWH